VKATSKFKTVDEHFCALPANIAGYEIEQ